MKIEEFYEIGRIWCKSKKFLNKLEKAIDLAAEQLKDHKSAYIAVSGGKDSGVLAFIIKEAVKQVQKEVKIWCHVSDASFPKTIETVNEIAKRLNIKVDFYESEFSSIESMKDREERRKFGKTGIFYKSIREYAKDKDLAFVGVRAAESKRRMKAAKIHGQLFHSESMGNIDICYPLLWFRLEDIAAATILFDIPLHPIYSKQPIDMGKNANGEDYFIRLGYITSRDLLDKGTAVFLQFNYPEIFSKLVNSYPDIRLNL